MIKEALQYLIGLGEADIHEINGQKHSDKPLQLIEEPTASPFIIHTLTGVIDYLKSEFDGNDEVIITVVSPTQVQIESQLNIDSERNYFAVAEAYVPRIPFDTFQDTESLNIQLQSMFKQTEDRNVLLKVIGNLKEENVRTTGDDGTSQAVTINTGIASANDVKVPNPVTLAPYRTFVEVEQPESDFVFRMKDGPRGAIFEADGGAWKNEAIANVRDYLSEALYEEKEAGRVTIIA